MCLSHCKLNGNSQVGVALNNNTQFTMTTIVVFWEFMEVYRPKLVVKDAYSFPIP